MFAALVPGTMDLNCSFLYSDLELGAPVQWVSCNFSPALDLTLSIAVDMPLEHLSWTEDNSTWSADVIVAAASDNMSWTLQADITNNSTWQNTFQACLGVLCYTCFLCMHVAVVIKCGAARISGFLAVRAVMQLAVGMALRSSA